MSVSIINFLIKVAKHNSLFFIISNFFIEKFSVTTGNHYNILKSFKKKNPVILDIGGNVGESTIKFLKINPNSKIHIFEPILSRYKIIKAKFLTLKNVKVNNLGIGAKGKTKIYNLLYGYKFYSWSSFSKIKLRLTLKRHCRRFNFKFKIKSEIVEKKKLDSFNLKPDLIKIDVEGEELKVLKSSEQILKKYKPVIIIEINENPKMIEKYFQRFGYYLYYFTGNNLVRIVETLLIDQSNVAVNVIAIHKSKKNLITF